VQYLRAETLKEADNASRVFVKQPRGLYAVARLARLIDRPAVFDLGHLMAFAVVNEAFYHVGIL
jgi:hypothetical protein